MSTKTIQRWLKIPSFKNALEAAQVHQISPQETAQIASEVVRDVWSRRDELRSKEVELLDYLQNFLLQDLEENRNHRSIDRLIKISQARSQLLGLNAKNYHTLEALEVLLSEQIATPKHAEIVVSNLSRMEDELRLLADIDD